MTFLLSAIGLVLAGIALVVSTRMTLRTRFIDRLGAAVAGGTGILLVVTATLRPDLLWLALSALVLSAAWFAASPPDELAPATNPSAAPWQREDA